MYRESYTIPCSIIRGGTSKGVFFLENAVPPEGELRDKVLLSALGSPDVRQIDGLGGANSLTSKVCIIGPSNRDDADVDYTYGQVSLDKSMIDWEGNCGNLISGVGVFAISNNLLKTVEPMTTVRIYNTNSSKIIHVTYPVKDGFALSEGEYSIPGVPGTGAKLKVEFFNPSGSITKKLLPTGNTKDLIDLGDKGKFIVSIVDAGNPVVFLNSEELGLKGTELPTEIENIQGKLELLEEIRSVCSELIGIVSDKSLALSKSPAYPKICCVTVSKDYVNSNGDIIKKENIDLVVRMASLQKMHKTFAVTGAICTGAASKVKGTVVNDIVSDRGLASNVLILGQPYGPMEVTIEMTDGIIIKEGIFRTARKILDGNVYIPYSKIK